MKIHCIQLGHFTNQLQNIIWRKLISVQVYVPRMSCGGRGNLPVSEVVSSSFFFLRKWRVTSSFILHKVFNTKSPLRNMKWHIEEHISKTNLKKNGCSVFKKKKKKALHSKLITEICVHDAGDSVRFIV